MMIIMNSCSAYIPRNPNSEAQRNVIIQHNRGQGRAGHYQDNEPPTIYAANKTSIYLVKYVLSFFLKVAIVS